MKAFKIVMMNKHEIRIDAEEIPKVLQAISSGSPAILKQAIFNPSSYSHIIEDDSRYHQERSTNEIGHYTGEYKTHFEMLPDIFSEIKEIAEMKSISNETEVKQI